MDTKEELLNYISKVNNNHKTLFIRDIINNTEFIELSDIEFNCIAGAYECIFYLGKKTYYNWVYSLLDTELKLLYLLTDVLNVFNSSIKEALNSTHICLFGLKNYYTKHNLPKDLPKLDGKKLDNLMLSIVLDNNIQLGTFECILEYDRYLEVHLMRNDMPSKFSSMVVGKLGKTICIDIRNRRVLDTNSTEYITFFNGTKTIRQLSSWE